MANATLIYDCLWDDGTFGDVQEMYGCRTEQYTLVSNYAGKPHACRYYQAGDAASVCPESGSDPPKHRTQHRHGFRGDYGAAYAPGLSFHQTGAEAVGPFWFGFSLLFGGGNPTGGWEQSAGILWDIKSASTEFGEPTAYCYNRTTMYFDPSPSTRITIPVVPETWFNLIFYLERRQSGGVAKLWKDGQLVTDYTGRTMLDSLSGQYQFSYFRTGVYWGNTTHPGDFTFHYADVRVAVGGSDGYALVDPAQSTTPPAQPLILPIYRHSYGLNRRRRE